MIAFLVRYLQASDSVAATFDDLQGDPAEIGGTIWARLLCIHGGDLRAASAAAGEVVAHPKLPQAVRWWLLMVLGDAATTAARGVAP